MNREQRVVADKEENTERIYYVEQEMEIVKA